MGKTRYWPVALASLLALGISGDAQAEELSRQGARFVATFDGAYGQVPVHAKICSGTYGLDLFSDAENLAMAVDANLYFVGRDYKAVPKEERNNSEIKTRGDKFEALKACQKTIKSQQKVLKAERTALKARHRAFGHATSKYHATLKSMLPFLKELKTGRSAGKASFLATWKADLEALHTLCTGDFSDIKNDECKLAGMHAEVVKQVALNTVARFVSQDLERIVSHSDDFEKYNGYFRIGKLAESALFAPQSIKDHASAKFLPVLAVAGLSGSDEVWAGFNKEMIRFKSLVLELGPKWENPKKAGSIGPIAKAAKTFFKKSMPKGAKIKKSYLTRGSWQIHKNSAGTPISRSKPGFIIYTEPGDSKVVGKLCRGRSFTYSEKYSGRKYSKADVISELGYVRIGPCR